MDYTPLIGAAVEVSMEAATLLIAHGADPDRFVPPNWTPWRIAQAGRFPALARYLQSVSSSKH